MTATGAGAGGGRTGRRRRRRAGEGDTAGPPDLRGIAGGRYAPLSESALDEIDAAAREILASVGLSDAPPEIAELMAARGARLSEDGRLTIPGKLLDAALAGLARPVTLHGRGQETGLVLSGARVHTGSGGAAPSIVDLETGRYRDSTLKDLHDAARLVDALENVHFFSRSLVARDVPDAATLDINTAYASLAGTTKHVCTSVAEPATVAQIAEMVYTVAGSRAAFVERPFLSLNVNHVAPPLRLVPEACAVLAEAVRHDLPVHVNTFGQLGASSPVTIAGSLAQTMAETLAGMVIAWAVNAEARAIFGPRPMITDLRTGAMSGGGGEQAVLMAGAIQMARHYGLANSCIAGATDAKIADAQSGYEKCLSVTLAAQAGANLITQACGMQASLMGCSLEAYVIDNDMLGAILRALAPVEVDAETLSVAAIGETVRGAGHFLGEAETYRRMQSDFLYPRIADRLSPADWEAEGGRDIRDRARARTREILASHEPAPIPAAADRALRAAFDIRLPVPAESGR